MTCFSPRHPRRPVSRDTVSDRVPPTGRPIHRSTRRSKAGDLAVADGSSLRRGVANASLRQGGERERGKSGGTGASWGSKEG